MAGDNSSGANEEILPLCEILAPCDVGGTAVPVPLHDASVNASVTENQPNLQRLFLIWAPKMQLGFMLTP
jgi:hypothetical protein